MLVSCWAFFQNLQGQGEIIGVADTGVDMNHCHFSEDDGDTIEASDWESPTTDLTKRKVVQYIQFVDDFDGEALDCFSSLGSFFFFFSKLRRVASYLIFLRACVAPRSRARLATRACCRFEDLHLR